MGQKVNPHGFRLGITTEHRSRWLSNALLALCLVLFVSIAVNELVGFFR